ncbi:MAG: energy-coupling factor ABC transporter ATP-binding protein [Proteobacteria bacterium]|nr:energy-coupling factor ABC transporter ATP-binding protein [Pseudomonadota bacterium]
MTHHIVEVKEVEYSYPDTTPALNDISFRIVHGESVAIVGANGAGKSTLLLHLNGYLAPAKGEIRIGDFPLTKETLHSVRRTVGMVFQDPDDQLFMPTVFDDVAFGPLNLGLPTEEVSRRVEEALSTVGALHLKGRPPYKLSRGEKKAVAIATVLSMSPDILVMDEPTSDLDPRARRKLIDLLKGFEHTKIIATHDLDMVLDLCERTIVISEGRVTADGPTNLIFQDEGLLARSRLEKPLRMQGCPVCGPTQSSSGVKATT